MRINTAFIVITDIGSTTTKAMLLDQRETLPRLLAISQSPTTVEAPTNDVKWGIISSIRELERQSGIKLIKSIPEEQAALVFDEEVSYLTTSSAGGGLQILVIGLTLFDSASSAKRAAYGAGGVILDTFAIDDKRQAMEQMLAMRNLHPDLVLLSGGTDGGAISGVLRLAEILRLANPAPKFESADKIPAIYAGNQDAANLIRELISGVFDLYLLPNLRPTMQTENLQPTQEKIQQLFMENVMEHAPGYHRLKPLVANAILPTPLGVQGSLSLATKENSRNIFAFDLGGATTDVFSYVNGHFQRTVSANLGMSYSALNVLKECGVENILRWLDCDEETLRDYVANKCLRPSSIPQCAPQFKIEHALAREALSKSLEQHRQMHYNAVKIGFLDKLKNGELDKYEMIFEYMREEGKYSFAEHEIDVLIGAGGVFAHAQNHTQSALILIDAFRPKGITEIWIDRKFITPHLGVLSTVDPDSAARLLSSDCIQELALHIAPLYDRSVKKALMRVTVSSPQGDRELEIKPGTLHYLPSGKKSILFNELSHCSLGSKAHPQTIETELAVFFDTRLEPWENHTELETAMQLYQDQTQSVEDVIQAAEPEAKTGTWRYRIDLPFRGEIMVGPGAQVQPDDIVAVNQYNPPRLFILDGFSRFHEQASEVARASLLVKAGDVLDFDQVYARIPPQLELPRSFRKLTHLSSPVRGKIELIDPGTGIMVVSEIQDYSRNPVSVKVAVLLGIQPKHMGRYLTKNLGDFVYRNDVLARRLEKTSDTEQPSFVKAPNTGKITNIDRVRGTLTIAYSFQPLEFQAHVQGRVEEVIDGQSLTLSYEGTRIEGRIGFGRRVHGPLTVMENLEQLERVDLAGHIVALADTPNGQDLESLARKQISGLLVPAISALVLSNWLGFEPGVINTGNEQLPFSLIVLDRFGRQRLSAKTLALLKSLNFCYLDPHTRIRAGVARPFICCN